MKSGSKRTGKAAVAGAAPCSAKLSITAETCEQLAEIMELCAQSTRRIGREQTKGSTIQGAGFHREWTLRVRRSPNAGTERRLPPPQTTESTPTANGGSRSLQ